MANRYPLTPMTAWAGLVAEVVIFCEERDEKFAGRYLAADGHEDVLFVIDGDKGCGF